MRQMITILLVAIFASASGQQSNVKILEQRAKDFHNAISKNDKEVWRAFMKSNFTQTLIDRPMRAQISTSENDGTSSSTNSETRVDEKLGMFQQLHDDFGTATINSITVTGNTVKMVVTAGRMKGIFSLDAESKSPWLIDKMGIEVEAEN